MKKNNLITGIIFLLAGLAFGTIAFLCETRASSLFFGFAGAGISCGVTTLYKYFYWTKPENQSRYKEKLENEYIELHDELKQRLRDKSGRYAYLLGLATIAVSIVSIYVLECLELVKETRFIIMYLGGLILFEYIAGIVIFKHLLKKY